jgi:hypothetical protein
MVRPPGAQRGTVERNKENITMIQPLSRGVRDYFERFSLSAIARVRDGTLVATPDPTGAIAAWWLPSTEVARMLRATRNGDVLSAAQRYGVPAAEHSVAVTRARAALAQIDAGLARAQSSGVLAQVNSEYQRRRLAARARGERFMSYVEVKRRLQKAMAGVAAGDKMPADLLVRVFDGA